MSPRRQAAALAAPAVAILGGVAVAPVLFAAWLSLHRSILVFHEQRFAGLSNYRFLLGDERFWSALGTTAYFTAVAVAAELLLGLPVAVLLQRGLIEHSIVQQRISMIQHDKSIFDLNIVSQRR